MPPLVGRNDLFLKMEVTVMRQQPRAMRKEPSWCRVILHRLLVSRTPQLGEMSTLYWLLSL